MQNNGNLENFSNNTSFSGNGSNFDHTNNNRKRKFNTYASDFENLEKDENILKKIRQGDKSIFLINKDVKSEIKSEVSNKNLYKDTVVRLKNRIESSRIFI